MKASVRIIVLAISLASSFVVNAQTRQESRQIDELNQRISQENRTIITTQASIKELSWMQKKIQTLHWEIASLDSSMAHASTKAEYRTFQHRADQKRAFLADLRSQYLEDSTNNVWRNASIVERRKVVIALTEERDKIFLRYNTSTEVPKELGVCEYNARNRGFVVRRQEVVLDKIEQNISTSMSATVNPTGQGSKIGYFVIMDNKYVVPIKFEWRPLNGGEAVSFVVPANSRQTAYILPGNYEVHYFNGGKEMGRPAPKPIDGTVHNYEGTECFQYAYMPRF